MKPKLIAAGTHSDERGRISFANDFNLEGICRFYFVENKDDQVLRAWQGHRIEKKFFFPVMGRFVIAWVKIDDFDSPARELKAEFEILNAQSPKVLFIPPGYANGMRSLETGSVLAVYSDLQLKQSADDTYRYPADQWFDWFQKFPE